MRWAASGIVECDASIHYCTLGRDSKRANPLLARRRQENEAGRSQPARDDAGGCAQPLSATTGCTRMARRAGAYVAMTDTTSSSTAVAPIVSGSLGLTR